MIVVAYHRAASLHRLLRGLERPGIELIVVNVEMDVDVASVARAAAAHVVDLSANPGYAAAVNAGVMAASAPLVVFMNDDVEIGIDDVHLLAYVVKMGRADVAVPSVRNGFGAVELTITALPTPVRILLEWALTPDAPIRMLRGMRLQKWRSPDHPERIDAAAAVVVATSRALLIEMPLPEEYFLYWEESEWFFRLRQRGRVVEYRPDAVAVHEGGRHDVRREKSALLARNAVRCVRRTQGRGSGAAALVIVVAWQLRLTAVAILRRSMIGARAAGLHAALGAWRELR